MVLYVSGKKEVEALKNALALYFSGHADEQAVAVAKILARVIVCEIKQGKEKPAPKKRR